MDKVIVTPLKQIHNPKGDILHAMKQSDIGYTTFGEAYFSTVNKNVIKGWKKHTQMTMNLIVSIGEIKFVIYDEEAQEFFSISLSPQNYSRLTVPPGLWVGFQGISEYNLLLNLASIEHDPSEAVNIQLEDLDYVW